MEMNAAASSDTEVRAAPTNADVDERLMRENMRIA
jgi:hypothetical protein